MREITIDGREICIRPLTRREIKGLKKYGFSMLGCVPKFETIDEAIDEGFSLVLAPDEIAFLDDQPAEATKSVWTAILKETYGAEDEEKNLPSTSGGTQTENE